MNVYSAAWTLLRRRPTAISYAFPTRVAVATICLVGGINARFILIGERSENWQMKHWGGALIPSVVAIWVMTLILWGAMHWVYKARHPRRAHVNLLNLIAVAELAATVPAAIPGLLLDIQLFTLTFLLAFVLLLGRAMAGVMPGVSGWRASLLAALVLPLGGMVAGAAVAVVGILLSTAVFWLYAAMM